MTSHTESAVIRNAASLQEQVNAALSHVLRNQVSAMAGYASLLETSGPLTVEQTGYLERIQITAQRITMGIDRLIDLTFLEAGASLNLQPAAISALLESTVQKAVRNAGTRDITLNIEPHVTSTSPVTDQYWLGRALDELLDNAIRYSDSGTIIRVLLRAADSGLAIIVQDQGWGIDPAEHELVFDRMYRSRDARVRRENRPGLGLTLASQIAIRHGGSVSLTSEPGAGSAFALFLPVPG